MTIDARKGTGATVRPISLEHQRRAEHPVAAPAVGDGQGHAEQIGLGQLGPGVGDEQLAAGGLEVAQHDVGDLVAEDLCGQVARWPAGRR